MEEVTEEKNAKQLEQESACFGKKGFDENKPATLASIGAGNLYRIEQDRYRYIFESSQCSRC
ncbi:MAG: hypothetical protein ACLSWM_03295 [Barnesiella sp.]|jgi:hypothetical protein|nr:hypothetical protein [Barnesiella sp. GGCC_0306]MBS7039282.1 hypothetical protein [Bacteroidales bacterium]